MPGASKKIFNEREARLRAQRQRVYISGIEGHHSLEVGVAYHFRGHFIYSYPAGNPIEPIPFSTRKGITIVGTVQDRAPIYNSHAADLVQERDIAALYRSSVNEWEFQQQQEATQKEDTAKALEEESQQAKHLVDIANETAAHEILPPGAYDRLPGRSTLRTDSSTASPPHLQSVSRPGSHTSLASLAILSHRPTSSSSDASQISTVRAPSMLSVTAHAPQILLSSSSYTPHDRAQFLAYSAPGSRHVSVDNTPYASRPVSPTHGLGVRSSLRPVSSTSQLHRLLAEKGIRRTFSPALEVTEGRASPMAAAVLEEDMAANLLVEYINPEDITTFTQTVSRSASRTSQPPSRSSSRSHSSNPPYSEDAMNTSLYLPGLGHPDIIRSSSRAQTPSPELAREDMSANSLHLPGLGPTDVSQERRGGTPNLSSMPSFGGRMSRDAGPYKSFGTGRPRKASIAMNEVYNAANPPARPGAYMADIERSGQYGRYVAPARAPKCPLHGGICDGVTTTHVHRTQEAREGKGLKDLYPVLHCHDGRVMVDWARIRDEEMAKMGR
ncbi:Nn.00g089050.m01.CDS01 [Neocucurbitaria sp. VM-36]